MKIKFNQRNIPLIATILVFILVYAIGSIMYKNFFSLRVFLNLIIDNSYIGIIAVGMTFVILSGGIDLSVGSTLAFTSIFIAKMIEVNNWHPLPVFLLVLLYGAVFGTIMGSLIHFFELPAFLVTLVGLFFNRGLALTTSVQSIPIDNKFFVDISKFGINIAPGLSFRITGIIFIIIIIFGSYLSRFTKFGRNVYAIGGNEQSSVLMGLPIARTKILIYTMNSFLCVLGGIVYTFYMRSGNAASGGGMELDVIAAVVMGGTMLTGAVGFVEGTFVGVLIFGIIQTFINFQGNLSSWYTKIVIGVIILIFILLQKLISSRSVNAREN
jgi:galactofuranose transport system permease protein